MTTILLIIHLLIALALVGVILLQRSEGGALGIGGGGGGFLTGRGQANLLTRVTAVLAICFITTSLVLAVLASRQGEERSILDEPAPATGAPAPAAPQPETQTPEPPSPPVAE
jgi:preprotein translocase subunit SecG